MPNQPRTRYDVYISYNEADAEWVFEWLLPRLKEAGLTVAIDAESFQPGAPVLEESERVIAESRHILAILTPAYVAEGWDNFETLLVQNEDPGARLRRLIPLLLEECDPPARIKLLHWVEMTDPARREDQLRRVIDAAQGTRTLPELHPERIPDARQRWWELRGIALAGIVSLITLGLLGAWIWSQRGPAQMDRVFNLAVAQIGERRADGSQRQSELGDLLGRWIFNGLQAENAQYEGNREVLIWHDSLSWTEKSHTLGRIGGVSAEDRSLAADGLAQNINAHAVIYGHLSEGEPRQLTVEFFVPRRLGSESNLTIGRYQFGDPILIPANFDPADTLSAGALEERVTVRANALFWLLIGIRQNLLGRHAEALAIFQQAERSLPRWRDVGEGKEYLYFFIGREHLFLGQFDQAEAALQRAISLDPNFARAQIALGGVYFQRMQRLDEPAQRLSHPDLAAAFAAYAKGITLAQRASDPILTDVAQMAAASALRLQAEAEYALDQFEDAAATHNQAIDMLDAAIAHLRTTAQYRILGQAYQFLGLSYLERGQTLQRMDAAAEARMSFAEAVTAFDNCLAQEANLLEDEFFATSVASFCRSWKVETEAILAQFGG
ncbi:MAG: TIR domain-containing protein [Caldilineaceae bacterium]|nr:TIR domain-containing protein [Caldilineaceae bacterium]